MRRLAGFLTIVLAASMGLLPVMPDEHVHDVPAESGHHRQVTHRHFEAHQVGRWHAGTTLDHLDPQAVHETVFTAPPKAAFGVPVVASALLRLPQPVALTFVVIHVSSVPIHGPPRAPCYARPPPFSPA